MTVFYRCWLTLGNFLWELPSILRDFFQSAKPPPAKKKKKVVTPAQDSSVADRLVYLTGIPNDASEQEVTDLVGSFGKINNVILMPCSEEDGEKGEGQKVHFPILRCTKHFLAYFAGNLFFFVL